MRVLVVEDELKIAAFIRQGLAGRTLRWIWLPMATLRASGGESVNYDRSCWIFCC